jgi:hypothetical protein
MKNSSNCAKKPERRKAMTREWIYWTEESAEASEKEKLVPAEAMMATNYAFSKLISREYRSTSIAPV